MVTEIISIGCMGKSVEEGAGGKDYKRAGKNFWEKNVYNVNIKYTFRS